MILEWQELSKRAAALEELGRHREAITHLAAALAQAPDNDRLLCSLAYNHWRLGDYGQAQDYADRAIGANPNNEWAYRLRCSSLHRQNRRRSKGRTALQDAQDAVRLDPEGKLARYTLVDAQLAVGQIEAAVESAEQLRQIAPDWALTYDMLARTALRQQRRADAEAYAREALRIDPLSSSALNLLGWVLFRRTEWEEGIEACYRAVQRNPCEEYLRDDFYRLASLFCRPFNRSHKIAALLCWIGLIIYCCLSDLFSDHLSVPRMLSDTVAVAVVIGVCFLIVWIMGEWKIPLSRLRRLSAEVQHAYLTERKRRRASAGRWLLSAGSGIFAARRIKNSGGRVSYP